ncbi:hypothetical protein [Burkholderia multivorans]|uniref:hypothetical protein n=1 Tax=Burkholderia multivorans TaxID=87883 RepID=UPI003EBEEF37
MRTTRERRVHAAAVGIAIARIHFVVHAEPARCPTSIRASSKRGSCRSRGAGRRSRGRAARRVRRGARHRLLQRYADSFPAGYRDDYPARTAVRDIELIERVKASASSR